MKNPLKKRRAFYHVICATQPNPDCIENLNPETRNKQCIPPLFQFGDQNGDVKLLIFGDDGHPYGGNPVYLHCQVLKKSRYFSKRWSPDMSSSPEIILTLPPDGSAENYIDCIRLMYSSQRGRYLSFSDVDDALRILPVASELLFEDGIQACTEYLEAVRWTPEQKLRIRALLSSLQVNLSTDLAERLRISKSHFDDQLKLLKKTVPKMLSEILKTPFVPFGVPLDYMEDTVKKHIVAYFQEDIHPAIQKICRDALLKEFRMRIEGIKCGASTQSKDSACVTVLSLLDLIKLCKRDIFEAAFTIFVEDEDIADILAKPQISWPPNADQKYKSDWSFSQYGFAKVPEQTAFGFKQDDQKSQFERLYSGRVLEILVHRFLDALANGDIIIPKHARISFLIKWVPVIAYLICRFASVHNERTLIDCSKIGHSSPTRHLKFSKRFEGVTKILASLPPNDQKQIFNSFADTSKKFQTWERGIFHWWIEVIWMAVMAANGSHLQIE